MYTRMDTSKLPENLSNYTWEVINRLPDDFVVDSGKEGIETTTIRGTLGKWALTIIYDFFAHPDHIYVKGTSTGLQNKDGNVLLEEFSDCLEVEFRN